MHQSYDDFSEVVVIGYICSEQNLDVGALGFFFIFSGLFLEKPLTHVNEYDIIMISQIKPERNNKNERKNPN